MPPKLRKEKPTSGSNPGSTNTNMFDILSEESQDKRPAKVTHDAGTMVTYQDSTSPTRLDLMQNDIKSMVNIINALSHSLHKMDKLDKIDQLESRQKSSEDKITGMITDLRSEFEMMKTTSSNTTPMTYADILKNNEKQNKNTLADTTSPALEILKPYHRSTQKISTSTPLTDPTQDTTKT